MMPQIFKIGTRGSKLALAQADLVANAIKKEFPELQTEIKIIHTSGDKDRVRSLVSMSGSGVFVKELEESLLENAIDIAVHSLKDVPEQIDSALLLAGFLKRENASDVLISLGQSFKDLPCNSVIGTGSPRRILQLQEIRSDLKYKGIRGNLETRIAKVENKELAGIILGAAGLNRLSLAKYITEEFQVEKLTPAIGQGIIGIECKKEREDVVEILKKITDGKTKKAAELERAWMHFLGGGCKVPMAAYLKEKSSGYEFYAYLSNVESGRFIRKQISLNENFSVETVLETFGKDFTEECKSKNIILPKDANEHALLKYFGD